jgi:hypothetical protein
MEAHEAAEEAAKRQQESAMSEEGWTVVVHAKVRRQDSSRRVVGSCVLVAGMRAAGV